MTATCPHCGSTNEYAEGRYGGVVCKACSKPFAPTTYVTTVPPVVGSPVRDAPQVARDRLRAYVDKYDDYADRDRDILLITIFDRLMR